MDISNFNDIPNLYAYWSATESAITANGNVSEVVSVAGSAHPTSLLNSTDRNVTLGPDNTVGTMPAFQYGQNSNGYLTLDLGAGLDLSTQGYTIALLLHHRGSTTSSTRYVYNGRDPADTSTKSFYAVVSSTDGLRARCWGSVNNNLSDGLHNYATAETIIIRAGAGEDNGYVYRDGVVDAGSPFSTDATGSLGTITLGALPGNNDSAHFDCAILVFYDRSIDTGEVADLHGLLAHWRDNNEGPTGTAPSTTFGPVATNDDPSVTGWQWEESPNGADWENVGTILTDISGATTTTLTVNSAPIEADQTRVRCKAFSAKEPTGVVSHSAILTVQGGSPPEGPIILYETDFNSITDWTTGTNQDAAAWGAMYTWDGYTGLPNDFYAARQTGEYNTRRGYGTGHETVEILAANADKARGGTGKSFVYWREARETSSNEWAGDGLISIYLPTAQPKLYIEFDICFSEDLVKTFYGTGAQQVVAGLGGTKMFRVRHWNGSQPDFYKFFWEGDEWSNNPKFIWDIASNDVTGYRNYISCRARGTDNFSSTTPPISSNGDKSYSWIMDTQGTAVGGGDPKLIDKRDGTTSVPIGNSGHYASPDEIIGSSAHPEGGSPDRKWSRLAFFVQMNSAPGVADGRICQWLDDERTMNITNVEWIKDEPNCDYVEWNVIEIGGNNNFSDRYPDECTGFGSGSEPEPSNIQHQEWYSVDNLKIYSDIPGDRGLDD